MRKSPKNDIFIKFKHNYEPRTGMKPLYPVSTHQYPLNELK